MSFRRRQHRWLRRLALGFALATAVAAGNVSYAFAKVDEGGSGDRFVSTPGWSGLVDKESGIPLSAGIPEGDEPFIVGTGSALLAKDAIEARAEQSQPQVIPYLSHGVLTQPLGALTEWQMVPYHAYSRLAAAGTADGGAGLAAKDRIEETAVQPVGSLSHRELEELASRPSARPDDVADRFAHSDVAAQPRVTSNDSWTFERTDALMLVIGGTVLALGLGLALGYLSRPRLAGM